MTLLADLRLLRFLGAGEGLTRHHAELADTCHKGFVSIAALFRAILGKRGDDKRYRQNAGRQHGFHGFFLIDVEAVGSTVFIM